MVYYVMPVLRWEYESGKGHSLTIGDSIKIVKDSDHTLIANNIVNEMF